MRKSVLTIICMIATGSVCSQNLNLTDTVYTIHEVQVLGTSQKKPEIGKLDVPLKYVPISVSTVSAKDLEMRGIVNMQDAVKFLPNTRMRTTYGAYQQFEVRGFDYTPVMIDGVRDERTSITNSAPIPDLSSVETIELLKGPASVLYGHSTVGGILNIVRKSPTEKDTVNALLSYGSWDNKRAMMDFGGKFIGPFNYRAVINWSDVEGYRATNDKRFSGYFVLGATFDEKQTLDIRGGFNRDWYGTEIGLPRTMVNNVYNTDGTLYLSKGEMLPGLNKRWRYNNESDFMINNGSNIAINYSNKISENFKIENRLAYNYDNIDYFSTEELSYPESNEPIYNHYYMNGDTKKYISLDTVRLTYPLRFAYTVHTINEQIEASGKVVFDNGIKYNYLAGYNLVYFYRNTYRGYGGGYSLSDLIKGPGLYSNVPVYDPHSMGYMDPYFSAGTATRNTTHGVYLQNLLELSDKFKVMLSGRYDHFLFKTATASISKLKEREYTELTPFDQTSTSAFTYRIGAVYLPVDNMSIYGSFANFFMPYRDIVNTETTVYLDRDGNRFYPKSGEEAFKPQTGYQAELGVRYSINNLLQATASAFYIQKNNEKKTLNSAYMEGDNRKSVIGQVASSDSKGFEAELLITPVSYAALSLGYGYTDATIRDFTAKNLVANGYVTEGSDPQKGMRLGGTPKNTFIAAGHYRIAKGVLENLTLGATVTYTDNVYRDVNKSVIYPAYWLTDLSASYTLKNRIRLRVNVNNVFNEKYYNQSLGVQMVPCNPTNYLLTISYGM
ncbi:MAG: TonB-dependent receptor [Mediterranea sp.]|jgi:outer membrane receptor protein involved in Fe transport|nr:TonB-dependent receptor [Mediterranea sp.]